MYTQIDCFGEGVPLTAFFTPTIHFLPPNTSIFRRSRINIMFSGFLRTYNMVYYVVFASIGALPRYIIVQYCRETEGCRVLQSIDFICNQVRGVYQRLLPDNHRAQRVNGTATHYSAAIELIATCFWSAFRRSNGPHLLTIFALSKSVFTCVLRVFDLTVCRSFLNIAKQCNWLDFNRHHTYMEYL